MYMQIYKNYIYIYYIVLHVRSLPLPHAGASSSSSQPRPSTSSFEAAAKKSPLYSYLLKNAGLGETCHSIKQQFYYCPNTLNFNIMFWLIN